MKVNQIATLVNAAVGEVTGKTGLLLEDLSNVVEVGTEVFNASVDNYVKSLINQIGKVIFVDRAYTGGAPSVLMDGWEFGSILEKIQADLPEAADNPAWDLQDGQTYNTQIFHAPPTVSAKFYNSRQSLQYRMSVSRLAVKESFQSAQQLNAFLSMLYNQVDKAMTLNMDGLIMMTINNMIAMTASGGDTPRYINLLSGYNAQYGTSLTAAETMTSPEFIRYASYIMGLYVSRLSRMSTLFNAGGKQRFTPKDLLHVILLSDFEKAAGVFLQSDVYHEGYVRLPNAESVPFWQGSGTAYNFGDVSSINIIPGGETEAVEVSGVLGVMFDRDALGVANMDRRMYSDFNEEGEFYTNWYKFDAQYFNDMNENFVVFYVADPA